MEDLADRGLREVQVREGWRKENQDIKEGEENMSREISGESEIELESERKRATLGA